MVSKVVENKILKLSIDDLSLRKGLSNALNNLKGLQKGIDSVKPDSLKKVGESASGIGGSIQGLLSKVPILGTVASSILNIGASSDKSSVQLANLSNGANMSGLVNMSMSAADAITEVGYAADISTSKLNIMDTALGVLAGNMLTKGVEAVQGMFHEFTSGLRDGFAEYELKMNSVQTILANTASKGTTLDDVTAALDELNEYADLTIYNFADMTSAIGKFTTTGMDLDTSVVSVKGLANAAALAGASSTELSQVLPQVAQALSQGYFQKLDWKSIQNMHIETEGLKETLMRFGKEYGTLTDDMGVTSENFAMTLTETAWLTTDVWNAAMAEFADTTTEIGARATRSATEIKTFTQLIDTTKEAIGSGWAQTWEYLIGNFNEARNNFTIISNQIENIVSFFADSRNGIFKEWHDLGGYADLWAGIINIISAVSGIFTSIRIAFSNVFGEAKPGVGILLALTSAFRALTELIAPGTEGFGILTQAFTLLFSVVKLATSIFGIFLKLGVIPLKIAMGAISFTIGIVSKAIEVLLSWLNRATKPIGDFVELITNFIGGGLTAISNGISAFFEGSIKNIPSFFDKFVAKSKGAGNIIKEMVDNARSGKDAADGLNIFEFALRVLVGTFDKVVSKIETFKNLFIPFTEAIKNGKNPIEELYNTLTNLGDKRGPVTDFLFDLMTGFKKAGDESFKASNLVEKFGQMIGNLASTLKSKWDEMVQSMKNFFDHSGEGLANFKFGESLAAKILKGMTAGLVALPVVLGMVIIDGLSKVFPTVGEWVETNGKKLLTSIGFEKMNIGEMIFGPTVHANDIDKYNRATSNMITNLSKARDLTRTSKARLGGHIYGIATVEEVERVNEVYKKLGMTSKITAEELGTMAYQNKVSISEMVQSIESDMTRANDNIGNNIKNNIEKYGIISGVLKSTGDTIRSVGKNIKDGLNFDLLRKGLDGTATASELASSKMASLGKFLKDTLQIDMKEFDKTVSEIRKNFEQNFNTIPKILKGVGSSFKEFFKNLDFSSKTALIRSLIKAIGDWAQEFAEFITKISSPLGAVVKVFSEMLGDIARGLEGSSLMNVGIILVIWRLLNILTGGESIISRFLNPFKELIEKIGNFRQAKSILTETAKAIKSYRQGNMAKNIFTLSKAFAVLAGSLFLLSLIPLDKMAATFKLFAGVITVATVAIIALQWAADRFNSGGDGGTGESIINSIIDRLGFPEMRKLMKTLSKATMMTAIASSVLMIGMTMVQVKNLSWEQILKGLTVASASMLILVGITKIASTGATLGDAARILALAFAVKMMVALVAEINKLELEAILKAGSVLMGISTIFALAIRIMNPKGFGIRMGAAVAIIALATGIKMMVGLIDTIAKISYPDLIKATVTITTIATVLTLAVALMTGRFRANGIALDLGTGSLKTSAMILTLTAGITAIAFALSGLSLLDPGRLKNAESVIINIIATIAMAMALMTGKLKTSDGTTVSMGSASLSNVGMLMTLIGGIMAMAVTVAGLSFLDQGKLTLASMNLATLTMILVGGLAGLLAAFKYLSDPDMSDVAMVGVFTLSLVLLSGTLMKLADIPFDGILKGITAMGTIILGMISIIWVSKDVDLTSVFVLASAALSIWGVAQTLLPFTTLDWDGIYKAITVLGTIALSLIGLMLIAKTGDIMSIANLLAATVSVVGLAYALKELSEISTGDMLKGILGLAGVLTVIVAAGVAILYTGAIAGILGLAAAAMMFGAAASMFGDGAEKTANALTRLWELIKTIVTDIVSAIQWLADAIMNGMENVGPALDKLFEGIGEFFGKLPEKALKWGEDLIKGFIDGISSAIGWIGEKTGELWDGITGLFSGDSVMDKARESGKKVTKEHATGILEEKPSVESATTEVTSAAGTILSNFANETSSDGQIAISNFGDGMTSMTDMIGSDTQSVMDAAGIKMEDFKQLSGQNGSDAMSIFGASISSQAGTVASNTGDVTNASKNILDMFKDTSKNAGIAGGGGFGSGIGSQSGTVANEASKLVSAAGDKLSGHDFSESGRSIGRSFGSGLSEMAEWVGKQASNLMQAVRNMFPNSPAKKGPFSGSGWNKVERSGNVIVKKWGAGIKSGMGAVIETTTDMVSRVHDALDSLTDYDSLDFKPSVTPVIDMSKVRTSSKLVIDSAVDIRNAKLEASYEHMNTQMSQIRQQQSDMQIVSKGLQIISDKMSELLDINNDQIKAIKEDKNNYNFIDGYDVSKRLAPTMLKAQQEYVDKINRIGGKVKPI